MRLFLCFFISSWLIHKHPRFVIVAGDITCKSCVNDICALLNKKAGRKSYQLLLENKGNLVANEMRIEYFQKDLPESAINVTFDSTLFPKNTKYPYVLKIIGADTIVFSYDLLFTGTRLNTKAFDMQ